MISIYEDRYLWEGNVLTSWIFFLPYNFNNLFTHKKKPINDSNRTNALKNWLLSNCNNQIFVVWFGTLIKQIMTEISNFNI